MLSIILRLAVVSHAVGSNVPMKVLVKMHELDHLKENTETPVFAFSGGMDKQLKDLETAGLTFRRFARYDYGCLKVLSAVEGSLVFARISCRPTYTTISHGHDDRQRNDVFRTKANSTAQSKPLDAIQQRNYTMVYFVLGFLLTVVGGAGAFMWFHYSMNQDDKENIHDKKNRKKTQKNRKGGVSQFKGNRRLKNVPFRSENNEEERLKAACKELKSFLPEEGSWHVKKNSKGTLSIARDNFVLSTDASRMLALNILQTIENDDNFNSSSA